MFPKKCCIIRISSLTQYSLFTKYRIISCSNCFNRTTYKTLINRFNGSYFKRYSVMNDRLMKYIRTRKHLLALYIHAKC